MEIPGFQNLKFELSRNIIKQEFNYSPNSMSNPKRVNNYYGKRRGGEDEWSRNPSSGYTKVKKPKYTRYESKESEYQYVQKDKRKYTQKELLDLADRAEIAEDLFEELCEKFGSLFLTKMSKPIRDSINISDFAGPIDKQEEEPYNGGYSKRKNFKKFDNFNDDSLDEDDYENADTMIEKKYYESKKIEEEDVPEWALEEEEENVPLWGDVDGEEVLKQTEDPEEWSKNYIKKIDDDIKENKSIPTNNDSELKTTFTVQDIQQLPELWKMMKGEEEQIEQPKHTSMVYQHQQQTQPNPNTKPKEMKAKEMKAKEVKNPVFENFLSMFSMDNNSQDSENSEDSDDSDKDERRSGYQNIFDSPKGEKDSESDDSNEKEIIPLTSLITGPPPPVMPKEEPKGEEDYKKEQSRKEFQEKYIVMDKVLSQVVYDVLNSRRRQAINMHSVNGINQMSAEKFCSNEYKIFSFLMQGDIFSKVWNYKDRLGNIQGPFMSFDMDIWNGEGNYFAKDLLISPNNENFQPLSLYLDRDPTILDIMQETIDKLQQKMDPLLLRMMMPPQRPQNNYFPPGQYPGQPIPMMKMQGKIPKKGMPLPQRQPMPPQMARGMRMPAMLPQTAQRAQLIDLGDLFQGFPQQSPPQQKVAYNGNIQGQPPIISNLSQIGVGAPEMTKNLKDLLGINVDLMTGLQGNSGIGGGLSFEGLFPNPQDFQLPQSNYDVDLTNDDFPSLDETMKGKGQKNSK